MRQEYPFEDKIISWLPNIVRVTCLRNVNLRKFNGKSSVYGCAVVVYPCAGCDLFVEHCTMNAVSHVILSYVVVDFSSVPLSTTVFRNFKIFCHHSRIHILRYPSPPPSSDQSMIPFILDGFRHFKMLLISDSPKIYPLRCTKGQNWRNMALFVSQVTKMFPFYKTITFSHLKT